MKRLSCAAVLWLATGAAVAQLYPAGMVSASCQGSGTAVPPGFLVDLDQDGDDDLVANWGGTFTAVCKAGGGTLGPPLCQQTGYLYAMAAADLDGDGDRDLVAIGGASSLFAFLNDGTGAFSTPPIVSAAPSLSGLKIGRLNNDGIPDVILFGAGSPTQILLGTGLGTFLSPTPGPTLGNPAIGGPPRFVLQDDDLDGDDDLHEVLGTAAFVTYRNNGLGSFAAGIVRFNAASQWVFPAFADVNLDGHLDALVVGNLSGPTTAFVQVALGNAAGALTVGPVQNLLLTDSLNGIALADFDGDGDRDLLAQTVYGGAFQSTNLAGTFSGATFVNKAAFTSFAVGDVTADGRSDAVFFNTSGYAAIETGAPVTGLTHPVTAQAPAGAAELRMTDLDADGRPDAVMGFYVSNAPAPPTIGVHVILNVNVPVPTTQTIVLATTAVPNLAIGDWNRDGSPDVLATTTGNDLVMLAGSPTGALQPPVLLPIGVNPRGLVPADVNQDGNLDVIVNHGWSFSVQFGNGAGGFGSGVFTSTCPTPLMPSCSLVAPTIAADDLNQDGFVDVVVFFPKALLPINVPSRTTYLGNGTGSFTALPSVACPGISPNPALALRDFTGDSIPDLLLTDAQQYTVYLLPGLGGGNFGAALAIPVSGAPLNPPAATPFVSGAVATGDLNGDGYVDAAIAGGAVLLSNGAGTLVLHQSLSIPASASVGIADLDRDLQQDLVFASPNGLLSLVHNLTPCSGGGWTYGLGCPGTGGFVPSLSARGCASPGGLLTLAVERALGGAGAATFVVSGGPTNIQVGGGCGILIQLAGSFTVPFSVAGPSVAGQGRASVPVFIPPTITPGTSLVVQAAILDAVSPFQYSATNGLALVIQ
jgi:hypothetical protein